MRKMIYIVLGLSIAVTSLILSVAYDRVKSLEKRISRLEEDVAMRLEEDYSKWRCTHYLEDRCVQYTERYQNE